MPIAIAEIITIVVVLPKIAKRRNDDAARAGTAAPARKPRPVMDFRRRSSSDPRWHARRSSDRMVGRIAETFAASRRGSRFPVHGSQFGVHASRSKSAELRGRTMNPEPGTESVWRNRVSASERSERATGAGRRGPRERPCAGAPAARALRGGVEMGVRGTKSPGERTVNREPRTSPAAPRSSAPPGHRAPSTFPR
jgi:hypothetical protein